MRSEPIRITDETSKGQIVDDYLSRFPDAPALTLAKLIHRSHPQYFKDVENARGLIRYRCGTSGDGQRKHAKFKREKRSAGYIPPAQKEIDWSPYKMPDGKTLVLSDIHMPFHDQQALEIALKYGRDRKVDNILLNGDLADCHQLSRFSKRPTVARFQGERDTVVMFLHTLREMFTDARIVWKMGNHEERLEDYILSHCLALFGLQNLSYSEIFQVDTMGIELVGDKQLIHLGPLTAIHAHELPRGMASPVNPARGFFTRTLDNVIGSHHHQTSHHVEKTVNDRMVATWSTGCLCDLHPRYMPLNKWNLGFAVVEHDQDGFSVDNKRIYKGEVW